MATPKLNLVVAACNNRGIGLNGQLPWKLTGDMAFFKRITSDTKEKGKQNAVIMGRKTWESIPSKFRPLPNRLNVVISRTMESPAKGVYVARSLDEAVDVVTSSPVGDKVDQVFIIGGSSIYRIAMESPFCHRIYMTHVMADFECDVHMPEIDTQRFSLTEHPDIDHKVQFDEGVEYKFQVYEKVTYKKFNVCAAMLEDRGIGRDGNISWPPIAKDYEYYLRLTSKTSDPSKKCVNIKGRVTWEETGTREKSRDGVINIVISKTYTECPEYVHNVARDLNHALQIASTAPLADHVETVWVMGGQHVYQDALKSPFCDKLYLTKINALHLSDRFFPRFEDDFTLINDVDVPNGEQEENGVKFQFLTFQKHS